VHNHFVHDGSAIQIKVVDYDYWDDTEGKWRENVFGSEVVDPNHTLNINNVTLNYVGGESGVQVRVQFKYLTASNGWSETLDAYGDVFTCGTNEQVDVDVD
jgi:hypothetical protein